VRYIFIAAGVEQRAVVTLHTISLALRSVRFHPAYGGIYPLNDPPSLKSQTRPAVAGLRHATRPLGTLGRAKVGAQTVLDVALQERCFRSSLKFYEHYFVSKSKMLLRSFSDIGIECFFICFLCVIIHN